MLPFDGFPYSLILRGKELFCFVFSIIIWLVLIHSLYQTFYIRHKFDVVQLVDEGYGIECDFLLLM